MAMAYAQEATHEDLKFSKNKNKYYKGHGGYYGGFYPAYDYYPSFNFDKRYGGKI